MKYIVSDNLHHGISYALNCTGDKFNKVGYVNCTLPTQLANEISKGNYNFTKSTELMKRFKYHRVNNLIDLKNLINLEKFDILIIEFFSEIIKLTSLDYSIVNALIVEILINLGSSVYIIDREYNQFIDFHCDECVRPK